MIPTNAREIYRLKKWTGKTWERSKEQDSEMGVLSTSTQQVITRKKKRDPIQYPKPDYGSTMNQLSHEKNPLIIPT